MTALEGVEAEPERYEHALADFGDREASDGEVQLFVRTARSQEHAP